MDFFKNNFEENFNTYQHEFFLTLSDFIGSKNIEDVFNFTYLDLYLFTSGYEERFFSSIKRKSQDYWFHDGFKLKLTQGYLYQLGFNTYISDDLNGETSNIFQNMQEVWLDKIQDDCKIFIQSNDFNLMEENYDINKLKGKRNRGIAAAYKAIFNTDGWVRFISKLFSEKLSGFAVVQNKNLFYVYKNVGRFKVKIEIKPNDILSLSNLLSRFGVFNFEINFSIEYLDDLQYIICPPEFSSLLTDYMYTKYSIKFKSASYEEAKIRIYANITAYCQLINILLPCLERLLTSNDA